jgi:plastocyanin
VAASAAAFCAGTAEALAAATIIVEPSAGEDAYSPQRVTRPLEGATFTWIWGPQGGGTVDPHDVQQDAGLFDSGVAQSAGSFQVTASAGSFPYYCSLHYEMRGQVAVRPAAERGYPRPFRVRWATPRSETGRRFEVRYKSGAGSWEPWLRDTERHSAVFGGDHDPVRVRQGVAYRFQARALRTRRKLSGWSPPLVVGG